MNAQRLRLLLLVVVIVSPGYYCWSYVNDLRDSYERLDRDTGPSPADRTVARAAWTNAVASMGSQNSLLTNWAFVMLGGIVALATTTKVHPIPALRWIYLLNATSLAFLAGSLWAGVIFQRRAAALTLNPDVFSIGSLNALLRAQTDFLELGLIPLAMFATAFMGFIVAGTVEPIERK